MLPPGAVIDDAVGLRINERSFPKLGPVVKGLTTIDTASIAPPGTVFLDECITQVIVCTLYVKATTAAAPTIRDFTVALDSNQGNVTAVVTLQGLHVPVNVAARVTGIPANCRMNIDASTVTIDGDYLLRPDPADPHHLDVNLVGASPTVTLGGVTHDFVGGVCSIPGIEQIVDLFLPDVKTLMHDKLTVLLGDPDGGGPGSTSPATSAARWASRSTSGSSPPAPIPPASACAPPPPSPPAAWPRRRPTCPARWPSPARAWGRCRAPRPGAGRSTWPWAPRRRASTSCWRARRSGACST